MAKLAKLFTTIFLPLIFISIIFLFSSIPDPSKISPHSSQWFFYPLQFITYGMLSLIVYLCLKLFLRPNISITISYVVTTMVAVAQEIYQLYVPGRRTSVVDLLTASAGAFLVTFIIDFKLEKNEEKLQNKKLERTRGANRKTGKRAKTKR